PLHQDRERRQVATVEEGLVGVQGAPGCQSEAFERCSRELHRRLGACRNQVAVADPAPVGGGGARRGGGGGGGGGGGRGWGGRGWGAAGRGRGPPGRRRSRLPGP